jgi:hypothetical protein
MTQHMTHPASSGARSAVSRPRVVVPLLQQVVQQVQLECCLTLANQDEQKEQVLSAQGGSVYTPHPLPGTSLIQAQA